MSFDNSLNLGISDAVQSIKDAAGIVTTKRHSVISSTLPWQASTGSINSRFFRSIDIDPGRWDQLFPYRLVVIDSETNEIVGGSNDSLDYTVTPGTGTANITFENLNGWIFVLPITPQQLNIQDQYAISTQATLRGILEEHSGVRFKLINIQGTLGVWPQREAINKPPGTPGVIQSLFGGTIEALGGVVGQVNKVINSATGNHPANKPTSIRPETSQAGEQSTGYYQALQLQQFLEQYAEAKLDPANASWRLVFDIPKQNQSFIVTPMSFTWQQNVARPMEIMFSLQLKAWRRINLDGFLGEFPANNQPISPGILQRIMNTISEARKLTSASINLIGAVRSDVEFPLSILRQLSLFVKDLAGVAVTAADLPTQVARDFKSSIASFLASLSLNPATASGIRNDPTVASVLVDIRNRLSLREGLSMDAVSNGQLGAAASINQQLDPINNILNNPDGNFGLFDSVPLSNLALNATQQNVINTIIENARLTTVDTLKKYRITIQQLALQLSNSFGSGDAYYNRIYGLPAPTPRIQPITLDEYGLLNSLYQVMQSIDILSASTAIDDINTQTNMDYVAGLADIAGIPFSVPTSKVLAPVPFGATVEQIAFRYLGDAQRWLEIVTLNNLRDPYIDENGFQYPLLSNATGRQITVESQENLYVGQRVVIKSATQVPSARVILGIDRLSDTSFLLTLDGLPNLDNFVTSDLAYLQAYLPGTVNSQQKIFIPSDLPVPDDSNIIPPPSTSSDPLTGLSKVDWLLTDTGDLAVNNFGDFRYSSGITNIIQALRIKFGTKSGTVLVHPNFGLGIKPGTISSDLQIQDLFNSFNEMVVQDPRFSSISNLQIILKGPTLTINLGVSISGQTGVFPVSFDLTP
ncbi:MAG: hypothetical protein OIN85_00815 [Candidatus Methanoperedens sp.]|nr:hypothetical protein [Candidatus Methanoperedens sp.]